MALRRALSEKLHFRTCTLHYLHPSLQAWYRAWHISESCWTLECNCQLKLILACIIKETVTYTDISDVSHRLTNMRNFPLFFSAVLRKIQLWTGVWFMIISLESLLFVNCFSWRVPNRGLFILNSGRNPGAVQCLPRSGPGWTQCLHTPGEGQGVCSRGFVTLLCHGSHLPFNWGSPLVFRKPAARTVWELPGWAEAVAPTKHSAATCRLASVPCLILSRLLKTSVTAVIHPIPWPLPSAPEPPIPFCTDLVCVEPRQFTGCCILA